MASVASASVASGGELRSWQDCVIEIVGKGCENFLGDGSERLAGNSLALAPWALDA